MRVEDLNLVCVSCNSEMLYTDNIEHLVVTLEERNSTVEIFCPLCHKLLYTRKEIFSEEAHEHMKTELKIKWLRRHAWYACAVFQKTGEHIITIC